MIRVALRQFRPSALATAVALAALVVVTAVTGPHLAHLYATSGIATCGKSEDCFQLEANFLLNDAFLEALLNFVILAVPALIGVFFGAPLVAREFEAGTHRLAWSQSVTRTRWILTKLVVVGLASMVCAAVVSITVTWWSSPIDRVNGNPFSVFDHRDVVPVAYAAFAFALGTMLGILFRRMLPAMAATLAGFVGVRLVVYEWIRPHFLSPITVTAGFRDQVAGGPGLFSEGPLPSTDWIISDQTINTAGHVIGGTNGNLGISIAPNGQASIPGAGVCRGFTVPNLGQPGATGTRPVPAQVQGELQRCITSLHLRELLIYQPGSRYWPFQFIESGLFVGLALILGAICVWWISNRLA